MERDIVILAKIAYIDAQLDDYEDELGDLPKQIKHKESEISEINNKISNLESAFNDLEVSISNTRTILKNLDDKEHKLSQQQFEVRNDKDFDAITRELKNLKNEHNNLSAILQNEGVKKPKLQEEIEREKDNLQTENDRLEELHRQYNTLTLEQSDEVRELNKIRQELRKRISGDLYDRYAKIRKHQNDAAVNVRKNACCGCYRQIPEQFIVEMRLQRDRQFYCENCGRFLIPEWVSEAIDADDLLAVLEE